MDVLKPLIFLDPISETLEKLKVHLKKEAQARAIEIFETNTIDEIETLFKQIGQCVILLSNAKKCSMLIKFNKKLIKANNVKIILLTKKELNPDVLKKLTKVGLTENIVEPVAPKTLLYKVNLHLNSIQAMQRLEDQKKIKKKQSPFADLNKKDNNKKKKDEALKEEAKTNEVDDLLNSLDNSSMSNQPISDDSPYFPESLDSAEPEDDTTGLEEQSLDDLMASLDNASENNEQGFDDIPKNDEALDTNNKKKLEEEVLNYDNFSERKRKTSQLDIEPIEEKTEESLANEIEELTNEIMQKEDESDIFGAQSDVNINNIPDQEDSIDLLNDEDLKSILPTPEPIAEPIAESVEETSDEIASLPNLTLVEESDTVESQSLEEEEQEPEPEPEPEPELEKREENTLNNSILKFTLDKSLTIKKDKIKKDLIDFEQINNSFFESACNNSNDENDQNTSTIINNNNLESENSNCTYLPKLTGIEEIIEIISLYENENTKHKDILKNISKIIHNNFNGFTIFYSYSQTTETYTCQYNSFIEIKSPLCPKAPSKDAYPKNIYKEKFKEFKEDQQYYQEEQKELKAEWKDGYEHKIIAWRTLTVPTWKDDHFFANDQEFIYPLFDGQRKIGFASIIFDKKIEKEDASRIEVILETSRGIFLNWGLKTMSPSGGFSRFKFNTQKKIKTWLQKLKDFFSLKEAI